MNSSTRFETQAIREMNAAWHDGRAPRAEQWIVSLEDDNDRAATALRLIYEEICLRHQEGERVDAGELYRRFPEWRDELEMLLDCHQLMQTEPDFPAAGDELGEFRLHREIDRGAAGRVFLATQPELSDRPLVVKLTPCEGDEHLSLARLQHTHIAPLYLVRDFPAQNLRALCMPYMGGMSLARALAALADTPPHQRSGRQLVEWLKTAPCDPALPADFSGPALEFLERSSYVQAVAWIGACLAEALQYAHHRGLAHLDVKPSNVLVAGDGQPLLLDFHLASPVIPAGHVPAVRLGGTRAYMSPEQIAAMSSVSKGQGAAVAVDARSDIYSFGLLLFESLAGRLPETSEVFAASLRQLNPAVDRSLADLVAKCLAIEPAERYPGAGEVAADLRRHLADLPLCGVPNRSLRERWQKWRRRRPQALTMSILGSFVVLAAVSMGCSIVNGRLETARDALARGREQVASRSFGSAIEQFQSGLVAVSLVPGAQNLKADLQQELALAQHARSADALHKLVEQLRFLDLETAPPETVRELAAKCVALWQARTELLPPGVSGRAGMASQLRHDLLDLALFSFELQLRMRDYDPLDAASADQLRVLEEAEALCGNCRVVEMIRDRNTNDRDRVPRLGGGPRDPWDEQAQGRLYMRAGDLEAAQSHFRLAVNDEPGSFWPNFQLSVCAYRSGEYEQAIESASVCVALAPEQAECFYNRGLIEEALGRREQALSDFRHALALDATMSVARERLNALVSQAP